MKKTYRTALLTASFLLTAQSAYAANPLIELNDLNPSYTNTETLFNGNGYDIWINGQKPFNATITNAGSLKVSDNGYGIYYSPFMTRGTTLNLINTGTIERIQLEEMDGWYQSQIGDTYISTLNGLTILNGASGLSPDNTNDAEIIDPSPDTADGTDGDTADGTATGTTVTKTTEITPETNALISGRVLLGTYANVLNYGGTFANLDIDAGDPKGNLITLANNGVFNNGVETVYDTTGVLKDVIFHNSILSTDTIQFAQRGSLVNGSLINNKSIILGDNGALYNIGVAFDTQNPDAPRENGATIVTGSIALGKNSYISNEMGTNLKADTLTADENVTITNGAEYSLVYENNFTAQQSYKDLMETYNLSNINDLVSVLGLEDISKLYEIFGADLSAVIKAQYQVPPIPHAATMEIDKASFKNNGTLNLLNNSTYTGTSLEFEDNGTINASNGFITLGNNQDINSGTLSFKNNGQLTLNSVTEAEIQLPGISETDLGKVEQTEILESTRVGSSLTVGHLIMQDNATINVDRASTLDTAAIDLKDNATVVVNSAELVNGIVEYLGNNRYKIVPASDVINFIPGGELYASQYISLGNNATFQAGGQIYSPLVNFKDDGKLYISGGLFQGEKLNMGERSLIDIYNGTLSSQTTVGSDSKAVLRSNSANFPYVADDGSTRLYHKGSEITGGFSKADGATNVTIESATELGYYGYLSGGINVDNILISSSDLRVSGDIRGNIQLATDTTLTFVGEDVYIHDPISKLKDATNTTVEILLNDNVFYTTTSDINVNHIRIFGGGMNITRPIQADDITLGSDTTLRLKGDFHVGNLVEADGDSVNTTLAIDGGAGHTINSSGKIVLDRVVVESGAFNVLHEINAQYADDTSKMPSAYEEGIELSTDTALNTFTDIYVNRIGRNQDVLAQGETVENTTLNVNAGRVQVERNVDIDTLNLNNGTFEFQNKDSYNTVNITNDVNVKENAVLIGQGLLNTKSGTVTIGDKARLAVSSRSIDENPVSQLKIVSSTETITDTTQPFLEAQDATLNFKKGSVLDLRADGNQADSVLVDGTVNIADGTRIIVRDIETNQEYELLSATQLHGNMDKIRSSFLWNGTKITNNNNTLTLKISGLKTLQEGISSAKPSQNVNAIANALTEIRESVGAYTIDPFLDEVYYADTAETAVKVMNEYSPEGYLNIQQNVSRVQRAFKNSAMAELDTMRAYRQQDFNYQRQNNLTNYTPNMYYYGRPGYERYYYGFNGNMARNRSNITRTDKGGMWAKPFMMSFTQDKKNNMSGYDSDVQGVTAGIDRRFGSLSLGIMALYATSDMEQSNKVIKADMTTYGAGIYGSIMPRATKGFIDFYALWSQTSAKGKHNIASLAESAKADFDITTHSMGIDWGYDIKTSRFLTITPKIGIDYTSVQTDKITEKGNSTALVDMDVDDYKSLQTPVEVSAAFDFGNSVTRLRPEGHVRWAHEFGDTQTSGKAKFTKYNQPFAVKGISADKDVITVGGSLMWLYRASELEVSYDYDYSSTATGHAVNVGYKYLF